MAIAAEAPPGPIDTSGIAPHAVALSLDTALARVRDRNPDLKMWGAREKARLASAKGANAWMPPELGIGGADLPYGSGGHAEAPGDPALMITARQMIPGWGKRKAKVRYLESLAAREKAGGRWMEARLMADAKGQYYRIATARRRLSVLEEAESVMAYMLKVAESRFKFRQTDLATVQEAQARLLELGNMRTMERSMESQSVSALTLLMGDSTLRDIRVDTAQDMGYPPEVPGGSVDLGKRADLALVDEEIRGMELNLVSMRRQGRPDYGIEFEHMEMLDMGRRYSVMAMATIPWSPWSWGMVRSDVSAMEKDIESMREERKARRLMAMRMARETRIMFQAEIEQHRHYRDGIVPAYRKGLDAAMASYQEGSGDLFRVLDIWDRWVMARMTMLDHFGKALVLEAEYERESGK